MTASDLYADLCWYDPRNPNYVPEDPEWGIKTHPRVANCACDPCFYGRDRLAVEVLSLLAEIGRLRAAFYVDGTSKAVRAAFASTPPEIIAALREAAQARPA